MNDFVLDNGDNHTPVIDIDCYIYDSPIGRQNLDTHPVDAQGKKLLQLCKNSRIRILNGRTKEDRLGNFTRYPITERESPSSIDYVLADCNIHDKIRSLTIMPSFGLSDHECLCVSINTKFLCEYVEDVTDETPVIKGCPIKYADNNLF